MTDSTAVPLFGGSFARTAKSAVLKSPLIQIFLTSEASLIIERHGARSLTRRRDRVPRRSLTLVARVTLNHEGAPPTPAYSSTALRVPVESRIWTAVLRFKQPLDPKICANLESERGRFDRCAPPRGLCRHQTLARQSQLVAWGASESTRETSSDGRVADGGGHDMPSRPLRRLDATRRENIDDATSSDSGRVVVPHAVVLQAVES
jgi:hypothetical protein